VSQGRLNPFVALALFLGGGAGGVVLRESGPATSTQTVMRPPRIAPAAHVSLSSAVSGGEEGIAVAPQRRGFLPTQVPTFTPASGCGIERWAVKTMTDPGANEVNLAPQDSTIADLVGIAPPAQPTDRVAPTETTTWRITVHMRLSSPFGGDSSVRERDLDAGAAEVDHRDQRVGGVETVSAV
jgi:hypothetical protein